MKDEDFVAFLQRNLPQMRMRWAGFRKVRRQVRRRVSRRLRELGLEELREYEAHLAAHPEEWDVLDRMCTITISRFYRDRAVFDALRDPILPMLGRAARAREDHTISAWCAGCASGEEPYTLTLAWALDSSRNAAGAELGVVATDVDARLLERARVGCYPPGSLRELPEEWVEEAFEADDGSRCLRPAFRRGVTLIRQDIRDEMPPGPFDLVLCRNLVFTYYEPSLQGLLLGRILGRLAPEGLLIVGGHETVPRGDWHLARPFGALPIYRLTRPPGPE